MIAPQYTRQVDLLLKVLPSVAAQDCFALHGGTAINLFVLDLPRLSVDIDLTYLPIETRPETLTGITNALNSIQYRLETIIPDIRITTKVQEGADVKLLCSLDGANIKIEVNTIKRGTLTPPTLLPVSDAVQDQFGLFAAMNIVPEDELWGGKICAALDRQHPRDLFDLANFFALGKKLKDVRAGFLLALLGHNRPFHEVLNPSRQNMLDAYERRFSGMSNQDFSYVDFEKTREKLCQNIINILEDKDKAFFMTFNAGEPDWTGFEAYQEFPSVKWKLQNIHKLKTANPAKHAEQAEALAKLLL